MKPQTLILLFVLPLSAAIVSGADVFDLFRKKTAGDSSPAGAAAAALGLSEDQMIGGLKEALGNGVQKAVANLGKPDGFLKDLAVMIPMPDSLRKVDKTLRAVGQGRLADEFLMTMNRAAEQATPEAAAILGNAVKQMSIADAKSILTGTNNAATQYFRRSSETNLYAHFLPIVKAATEKAGVTGAYKRMADVGAGGGGFGALGTFGGNLLSKEMPDIDGYVTHKALDGLFSKIADQEKLIRENPVARSTDLLKKVFGAIQK